MQKIFMLIFLYFSCCLAATPLKDKEPTSSFFGVNVVTGLIQGDEDLSVKYENYRSGWNVFLSESIFLKGGDSRIGKVRKIIVDLGNKEKIEIPLFYDERMTTIYEKPDKATVYHYQPNGCIDSIAHCFILSSGKLQLYRRELFYWQASQEKPLLISRVLEDEHGQAVVGHSFYYYANGQLFKETLTGNLSGNCTLPLSIAEDGYPLNNGVESYSKEYEYATFDPQLIITEREDSGLVTYYEYDEKTKKCLMKRKGKDPDLMIRCFYEYNEKNELVRKIVDDGSGISCEDMTGVNRRKVIDMTGKREIDNQNVIDPLQFMQTNDWEKASHKERYDSKGVLTATFDENGNGSYYHYDCFGRLVTVQLPTVLDSWDNPYTPEMTREYDVCDRVILERDGDGRKREISYNSRSLPTRIAYSDGSYEEFRYYLNGEIAGKRLRSGVSYEYLRDDLDRVSHVKKMAASGLLVNEWVFVYQGYLVSTITDLQGRIYHFDYNLEGDLCGCKEETTDGIKKIEWGYDSESGIVSTREWFGAGAEDFVTKIEEKKNDGKIKGVRFEDALQSHQLNIDVTHDQENTNLAPHTSITLNVMGQLVNQEDVIDESGTRTQKIYDALGRVQTKTVFDANGCKISCFQMRYDAKGNKLLERHEVLDEQGNLSHYYQIKWKFDAADRLISQVEGDGALLKTTRFEYNIDGTMKAIIKPDGVTVNYSYHPCGLIASVQSSDKSVDYAYIYDGSNRLISILDHTNRLVQKRTYNAFNELIAEEIVPGILVENRYDLAGRRTLLKLPDGTFVRYHYEGALLSKIERLAAGGNSLYQHGFSYQDNGNLQREQLALDCGEIEYGYDSKGYLDYVQMPFWREDVTRDFANRLVKIQSKTKDSENNQLFDYAQDGQIIEEKDHRYAYDSICNRLSDNEYTWNVNEINQLISTQDVVCQYDKNGHLIHKQFSDYSIDYHYDALDRLISIEYPENKAVDYIYDSFHRRIAQKQRIYDLKVKEWKHVSTEFFLYDGNNEIGKLDSSYELVEFRLLGRGQKGEIGSAISLELYGKVYIPLHDLFGHVRSLIDTQTKQEVESYTYSTFGKIQIYDKEGRQLSGSAIQNPWKYFSKRSVDYAELIYFGRRFFDPSLARWISPDPGYFHDGPNLYAFIKNDPLNYCDLYGLFSVSQIGNHLQSFASFCSQHVKDYFHSKWQEMDVKIRFPGFVNESFDEVGKFIFGDEFQFAEEPLEEMTYGSYGKEEINDKVRVTFINGMFVNSQMMQENLHQLSELHGGSNVHYIFRPSEDWWLWDVSRAIKIKGGYRTFSFRSKYAHLLAQLWRDLIQEIGGTEGGGLILHYAHSLGGTDTDRARDLLSPEEQRMIRVVTLGSPTLIENVGFQSVVNYVSRNDWIPVFDPVRYFSDAKSNIHFHGLFSLFHTPFKDHMFDGETYRSLLHDFGGRFLHEFQPS